jgi:TolB protein
MTVFSFQSAYKRLRIMAFAFAATATMGTAHAQLRVEISGAGSIQIPVAIAAFGDESVAPQQITAIIRDDLTRSGYFRIIDAGQAITETAPVNFDAWKARGADALVVGSVQKLSNGSFDVRYKLLDTVKSSTLSGLSLPTQPALTRVTAHKIADDIYEKLLGVRGAFATRISYVTRSGKQYHLEVADADGEGVQVALKSN